jgi:anti-repressor protein
MIESTGGRPAASHFCTIGMAKELCVLQRNEKGRMVRRRLIQIEEQRNQPAAVMARALKMADAMITELSGKALLLESKVEADAPKVMFAEAVSASDGSILIGQLAKYLTQNGAKIGQNRLFERLREEGFLCSARGERWNLPTQKAMEMSLFELKMNTMMTPDGPKEVKPTTKVTGKGQIYFLNRYLHLAS